MNIYSRAYKKLRPRGKKWRRDQMKRGNKRRRAKSAISTLPKS